VPGSICVAHSSLYCRSWPCLVNRSRYVASDEEQGQEQGKERAGTAIHTAPPAASPVASRDVSIFDARLLPRASSCESVGVPQLRTLSGLSDVTNASVLSENVDVTTPQVELSFGPASTRGRVRKPPPVCTEAAAGPGSPTVGDWTATVRTIYCLPKVWRYWA